MSSTVDTDRRRALRTEGAARRRASRRSHPRAARATIGDERESGQAMAEYAIVVAAVLGAGAYTLLSFLPDFIEALQKYYDSYYIILSLPIP